MLFLKKLIRQFIVFLKLMCNTISYMIINNFVLIGKHRAVLYNIFFRDFHFKKKVTIRKNVTFYAGSLLCGKLCIGENSFINDECFLDYSSEIFIGNNVAIGMRSMILSSSHKIGVDIRCGPTKKKVTRINDNCWLGAGIIRLSTKVHDIRRYG